MYLRIDFWGNCVSTTQNHWSHPAATRSRLVCLPTNTIPSLFQLRLKKARWRCMRYLRALAWLPPQCCENAATWCHEKVAGEPWRWPSTINGAKFDVNGKGGCCLAPKRKSSFRTAPSWKNLVHISFNNCWTVSHRAFALSGAICSGFVSEYSLMIEDRRRFNSLITAMFATWRNPANRGTWPVSL